MTYNYLTTKYINLYQNKYGFYNVVRTNIVNIYSPTIYVTVLNNIIVTRHICLVLWII